MSYRAWICEGCGKPDATRPCNCPSCRKEVCEHCFDVFAHCKECAAKLTREELVNAGNAEGFEFVGSA